MSGDCGAQLAAEVLSTVLADRSGSYRPLVSSGGCLGWTQRQIILLCPIWDTVTLQLELLKKDLTPQKHLEHGRK